MKQSFQDVIGTKQIIQTTEDICFNNNNNNI